MGGRNKRDRGSGNVGGIRGNTGQAERLAAEVWVQKTGRYRGRSCLAFTACVFLYFSTVSCCLVFQVSQYGTYVNDGKMPSRVACSLYRENHAPGAWFQRAYSFAHKKLLCYYVREDLATV